MFDNEFLFPKWLKKLFKHSFSQRRLPMKYPVVKNSVRGKLVFGFKDGFGYFWAALGTLGRLWAKLGFVKAVLGKKEGVNSGDKCSPQTKTTPTQRHGASKFINHYITGAWVLALPSDEAVDDMAKRLNHRI